MENTSFEAENITGGTAHNTTVQHERFTNLKQTEFFLLCIFFATYVLGLIGNGLVIFLTCCRMKTTVNSIWFLNLAIADFIFMLYSIGSSIILSGLCKWKSEFVIHGIFMILPLELFASIFFLVVISLDQCLCTWMVVWAKNKQTLLKARIICIIVWVSSIGCVIPFFKGPFLRFTYASLITYEFTVGFLIPFLIITSSYIAIGVRIRRLKRGKQLRSYRIIITITLVFFICWFPYYVLQFYSLSAVKNIWRGFKNETVFKIVSIYLVCLNSCLNPFLYVFMCDEYKKKLKQSLLLVLETAFAEDHLDIKTDEKGRAEQENHTELLDM